MGLFIGLEVSEKDVENIKAFQEEIQLTHPVKTEELHCTLFATSDNFEYNNPTQLPLVIENLTLGKIKIQSGVDCLVLYFTSPELENKHNLIRDTFKVKPYYQSFIPHITLSYDCGDIEIANIDLKKYLNTITFVSEYTQDLKFEENKRKKVRD